MDTHEHPHSFVCICGSQVTHRRCWIGPLVKTATAQTLACCQVTHQLVSSCRAQILTSILSFTAPFLTPGTAQSVALLFFPVVPAMMSAALWKSRHRAYTKELSLFFAAVDPTQLCHVQRMVDKLVALGPSAPDGYDKRRSHLERKYGRTFASVTSAAAAAAPMSPDVVPTATTAAAAEKLPSGARCVAEGNTPHMRWGILGCAKISRKNLVSIAQVGTRINSNCSTHAHTEAPTVVECSTIVLFY